MAKRTIKHIPGKRIMYRLHHPLIPKTSHFDSWMVLCEHVMEVAEEQAKKLLHATLVQTICKLSDEMIATAEEIDLNENKWNFLRHKKGIQRDIQEHNEDGTELPGGDSSDIDQSGDDDLSA